VGKWRARFLKARLDGLLDEPRPGAPRTVSDEQVERVIAKTLQEKPREATHWSSRMMAKASGLSQTAVMRTGHAFGMQPHRAETFKLSTDPLFIETVRDVVGLYLSVKGWMAPSAFPCALHPDLLLVAQSGRALVRHAHGAADSPGDSSQHRRARASHPRLPCYQQPQSQAFVWTKTADQILESMKRFCMRTSNSGH
jgi:hypothetical protein